MDREIIMQIEIIKSKRKSISVEVKRDLQVVVRAPLRMSDKRINEFIREKQGWIEKNIMLMKARTEMEAKPEKPPKFTESEIADTKQKAKADIPKRVQELAVLMGADYNRVSIKALKSRWGSCSAKRNLNFNCLLALCPSEVVDYVIIHELCHLKELNHSKNFWAEVSKYCPDYKAQKLWLKLHGNELIDRLEL